VTSGHPPLRGQAGIFIHVAGVLCASTCGPLQLSPLSSYESFSYFQYFRFVLFTQIIKCYNKNIVDAIISHTRSHYVLAFQAKHTAARQYYQFNMAANSRPTRKIYGVYQKEDINKEEEVTHTPMHTRTGT
jgi:hypothetical protein